MRTPRIGRQFYSGRGQPWFINEYIEWKDGYFWTEYAQLIENEL